MFGTAEISTEGTEHKFFRESSACHEVDDQTRDHDPRPRVALNPNSGSASLL